MPNERTRSFITKKARIENVSLVDAQSINMLLHSSKIWNECKKILKSNGASSKILGYTDEENQIIHELAKGFSSGFYWPFIMDEAEKKHVAQALKTCALVISKIEQAHDYIIEPSVKVGKAAHDHDYLSLKSWAQDDPLMLLDHTNRADKCHSLARIMRYLAQRFNCDEES